MDSSSENSFTWTDTSSDSFNSTSMAADNINEKSEEKCDSHNEKKKKEKKSASRKIRNDESVDKKYNREQSYDSETQSNNVKKMIKLEPESDFDVPKKKKKLKYHETNGNPNESTSYDETYLNMKVKQEECLESSSKKHKQKKHKRHTSTDSIKLTSREDYQSECSSENITLKQESELEINHSKKKKKKSKKRHDSMEHNEDKMDIEEPVVNKQDSFVSGNNTLHDESEDSGCNEISVIKCDDEHNIHTISIINKSLEDNRLNETTHSQHKLNNTSEHKSKQKLEATLHRTQSISDRILFEDDIPENKVSICENDYEHSKKSAKLKRFVRANPDLKQLSQNLDNDSNLTLDDEIWILQCPKEIDIKDFNDTSLNIHGKCKVKVAGKTYDGSAEEKQLDTVPLLTMEHNKYKIKNLHLSGIINLRKRIPKAHFHEDNVMVNNQTNFIPLPDTKCRHPLFGSNYKKALKIPTAIAERLMEVGQESLMKAKKKKKNKEINDRNMSEQANSQELYLKLKSEPNLSDEKSEKKKKKRKIVDDNSSPKKVKRMKYDPESAEAWESEKAIEENLFNF